MNTALQIPICIFSGDNYTFEEQILRIITLYPFVRLLSDTELKEEEYVVIFRLGKSGHHFIRIDENGNATDKDEDAYYTIEEDGYRDIEKKKATKPITFSEVLQDAYNNKNSSFL